MERLSDSAPVGAARLAAAAAYRAVAGGDPDPDAGTTASRRRAVVLAMIALWTDVGALPSGRERIGEWVRRVSGLEIGATGGCLAVDALGDLAAAAPAPRLAELAGAAYEGVLAAKPEDRRRAGAHFTAPQVARDVVRRALAPLLERCDDVLALRICDPAMGSGVILVQAALALAEGGAAPLADVVLRCIHGVDADPVAVEIASVCLAHLAGDRCAARDVRAVVGDAVVGPDGARWAAGGVALDWARTFPEVMQRGGFDAVVGNPPWVAYAGRAAQPIPRDLHAYFRRTSPAFFGYRTLQGVFVHKAASLVRPGGRVGLVVPTSMADLSGYAPARKAHDVLAEPDPGLPDYGAHAFEGVFQPAMGLVSTRREGIAATSGAEWDLARSDADDVARRFADRVRKMPTMPHEAFGERGFQTSSGDKALLSRAPDARRTVGLRVGADVRPFHTAPPSLWVDPGEIGARFRPPAEWRKVDVYVRQTARYPMVGVADGLPFRNSILAGFATGLSKFALAAYLNAWAIRFYHYTRFRDARQGMPQMKVAHLRALPRPGSSEALARDLDRIGRVLAAENRGVPESRQLEIDGIVSAALGCTGAERERIARFSREEGAMVRPRRGRALRVPDARSSC